MSADAHAQPESEASAELEVPSFWAYMPATIEALRARGGSATVQDLWNQARADEAWVERHLSASINFASSFFVLLTRRLTG